MIYPPMKLRKAFQDNFDRVNWHCLSRNPNANIYQEIQMLFQF